MGRSRGGGGMDEKKNENVENTRKESISSSSFLITSEWKMDDGLVCVGV